MTEAKTEDTPTIEDTIPDRYRLEDAEEVRLYMDHKHSGILVVNSPVDSLDPATGEVTYSLSQAETARRGTHRYEFVVRYPDGSQLSWPEDDFKYAAINSTLDREADVETIDVNPNLSLTTLFSDELASNTASAISATDDIVGEGIIHRTHIPAGETTEIPADHGTVICGPLTGEGSITGNGRLKII